VAASRGVDRAGRRASDGRPGPPDGDTASAAEQDPRTTIVGTAIAGRSRGASSTKVSASRGVDQLHPADGAQVPELPVEPDRVAVVESLAEVEPALARGG
jgi:hypothetical protein